MRYLFIRSPVLKFDPPTPEYLCEFIAVISAPVDGSSNIPASMRAGMVKRPVSVVLAKPPGKSVVPDGSK